MLMGPVFRSELLRTARRGRYYLLRALYGALLLLVVWGGYEGTFAGRTGVPLKQVASFAEKTFVTFAVVQLVTVLVLIPPLYGGAIADEKQRKTLHYLMASRLSGAEIVLDKVLGRLPHLGVFMAIGLPVVSILRLFGGIPIEHLLVAYGGTLTTAVFAVALTVLVSTLARGVRPAMLTAYLLLFLWLFVPPVVQLFGSLTFRAAYAPIQPYCDWLAGSSPFRVFITAALRARGRGSMWSLVSTELAWMAGLQLVGAALLLLVAVWQLRPTFRRQEANPARRTWFGRRGERRLGWLARPECGVDAILWKECHFAPTDIYTRFILLPAVVAATLPLALMTYVWWDHGFASDEFLMALRVDIGWFVAFWLLAVAGASASSVTVEREADTWVTLTSTPLTGWEILRAKVLGAVWNQRGFAAVLILLWLLGLVKGAVHPLGVLGSVAFVGVMTWLVAALGVYYSLQAQSTSKALTSTIVTLCLLNAYPVILAFLFFGRLGWARSFSILGAMPRLAVGPIVSYEYAAVTWGMLTKSGDPLYVLADNRVIGVFLLTVYVGGAIVLTGSVVRRFDRWLDRPRLTRSGDDPAPTPAAEGADRAVAV
jgi:ABC-type transport system involved in multi-copper enzyme maturation permease subunit